MPFAELSDARIFYQDTGSDRPAVIFSHGILMDHEMFAPQFQELSDEFRCIAYDERGHGQTTSGGDFTYWDLAADAVELLDHLGIERAIAVGMSQGGFLSLRAALKFPDRIAALALIDTQAGTEDAAKIPMYDAFAQTWAKEGPTRAVAEAVAEIIIGTDRSFWDPWIDKWLARPSDWVIEPYKCLLGREDISDRLHEISCPALIFHGTADVAISTEKAEALCEGLANCEGLIAVEDGPHASNLTHSEAVNPALHEFCRRHA
jgi:3-oxoadipate enol-lactonase